MNRLGLSVRARFGRDSAVVGTTLLACYAAARWPANAYLLLLTAVSGSIWYAGRLRAVVLAFGTMLLAAAISPFVGGPPLLAVIKDPPHLVLFVAVVALIGAAVETLRRARAAAEQHVAELQRLNSRLEQEMEEVRVLSDDLRDANDALVIALNGAEETAARASALQEVTAALSLASTAPDVADAVLTRGMSAVRAARGFLALADGTRAMHIIGVAGYPDSDEVRLWYSRSDDGLPLAEAMRERRSVWLPTSTEYRKRIERTGSLPTLSSDVHAHLALPLIHGEDVVGGLAFDFVEPAERRVTDELFTGLLAQATADALFRAIRFDREREARRTAEIVSRAREEVLGVVAHDLRNPLNLVGATAQLLMEPDLSAERRAAAYDVGRRAVRRMNRLIGDLLDVVRLEAGRLSLDLRPCDIERVLADAAEAFQARAAEQRTHLELVPAPPGIVIQADAERLLQLLDNLIGNALKFTPAGGRVTISAQVGDGRVRVAVADSGPGIPEEHLARLFDRFWQARGTDRRGLGLGLAIARGIAEAHGGRLEVESTVGSGSTFWFTLPLSAASSPSGAPAS
jgi:signal transduction histidine kinase